MESFFCGSCLESVSKADASTNRGKCKKCFECPICSSNLSYNVLLSGQFLLTCKFCYYNSPFTASSVNEISTLSLNREREDVRQQNVSNFSAQIKQFQQNNIDQGKKSLRIKRLPKVKSNFRFSKLSSKLMFDAESFSCEKLDKQIQEKQQTLEFKHIQPKNISLTQFEQQQLQLLSSSDFRFENSWSAQQTLTQISLQQNEEKNETQLLPIRKKLLCKKAKRCPKCEKLIVRPKKMAPTIEFESLSTAYNLLPRISFERPPIKQFENEHSFLFFLIVTNPASWGCSVTINKIVQDNVNIVFPENEESIRFPIASSSGLEIENNLNNLNNNSNNFNNNSNNNQIEKPFGKVISKIIDNRTFLNPLLVIPNNIE
eukprot:TRINITY_DN1288_c0_g2_i3.p1 TRINITY_DN1288_c0_g2~~TRINITY_DN1288_c0_g2_i3.p1  ORF type:complete len:373 (+),score=140.87 TRINITY_DN1288_c0_g2_i3:1-1119(+)